MKQPEAGTYDPDWHLPNDAICPNPDCLRLLRNNPETERVLALRGFKFYDIERDRMVFPRGPLRYCQCNQKPLGAGER